MVGALTLNPPAPTPMWFSPISRCCSIILTLLSCGTISVPQRVFLSQTRNGYTRSRIRPISFLSGLLKFSAFVRDGKRWALWAGPQGVIQVTDHYPWVLHNSDSKPPGAWADTSVAVPLNALGKAEWGTTKSLILILLSNLFILGDQDISEGLYLRHRGLQSKASVLRSVSYWTPCPSPTLIILPCHSETSDDPRHNTALCWHLSRSASSLLLPTII